MFCSGKLSKAGVNFVTIIISRIFGKCLQLVMLTHVRGLYTNVMAKLKFHRAGFQTVKQCVILIGVCV